MHEAAISEFPFVEALPKREKSKMGKLWEQFEQTRAAMQVHGLLVPQPYVAELLGVSRQRVHQLVNEGRLASVLVGNQRMVTEQSMLAWAAATHTSSDRPSLASQIFKAAAKLDKKV